MTNAEFHNFLQETAQKLRPITHTPSVSLVKIANERKIQVDLIFFSKKYEEKLQARCDLTASRPRIMIYRKSETNGSMLMTPDKEYLLTSRERFSIAHELGHCLAYLDSDVIPATKHGRRKENFRREENSIDNFANTLLVPNWLLKRWLDSISTDCPICMEIIGRWTKQCRISTEVATKALTRIVSDIGFLKVNEGTRLHDKKRVLIIFASTSGAKLDLPNRNSHIDDSTFVDKIDGKSGDSWIKSCHLDKVKCKNLRFIWKERKGGLPSNRAEFKHNIRLSKKSHYWISIRPNYRDCDLLNDIQHQLAF